MHIKGYNIVEKLHEGPTVVVYRATRLEDNKKVILKSLMAERPDPRDLETLQHEYLLLKKLDLPGIIGLEGLVPNQNSLVLVLEDIQGITLAEFLNARPINLTNFFYIAKQLVDVVDSLHKHNIIHKDINPYNIIIDPATLTTKLTDLSLAVEIFDKVESQLSPYVLEGNIAYISPEQTGRMNRTLDYRTDFYSLGVTFFQMLTGELPFKANDPIEWVHCHIAKIPPLVSVVNSQIPKMLSLIVSKLLEKIPEDRYSSTTSLRLDLNECAQQWQLKSLIEPFKLRQNISSEHLYISQKLYHRDQQIESLLNAFDRVSDGSCELLLVTGYSGIGKTSLIQEIQKPIVRQHGYFISGKFDLLQRSVPYSAIIHACQSLINQLLTEPDSRLASLRDEIMAVLGINGKIIVDILPELALIIGPQPPVVELQAAEAQNRFTMVFEDFFRIFISADHPMVIFLDDLQWADHASLQLMENILTNIKSKYLLAIGAYRDNEVKADHYLLKTIKDIMEVGIPVHTLSLSDLNESDVENLVADTLNQAVDEVKPLAKLIYYKTHGNPFFINQILKLLHQEGVLNFSYETNKWEWDINQIEQLSVTDNVVDLTITRLQKLPVTTQETLKLAACIGNQFDLTTLELIGQENAQILAEELIPALKTGLIKKIGTSYKQVEIGSVEFNDHDIIDKIDYQFIHDRVQQAAYDLIPESARKQTHLRIARLLLERYEPQDMENHRTVFEILQHYNKSLDLVSERKEKLVVAALNLTASQKAKRSIAYQHALSYVSSAIELLDESYWQSDYQLLFDLYRERSESSYLAGNHEESEQYFDVLLAHAKTNLEKADIYTIKVILYANRHQHEKSLATGIDALKLLGIKLPLHPTYHIIKDILKISMKLLFKDIENLDQELKEATDPAIIVASHVLMEMGPAGYIANPQLLALMATKRILINLKGGYCRYSITAYMTYALIVMTRLKNYKQTFALVELAGKLAKKQNHLPTLSRYYTTYALWFAHWRHPFSECIKLCKTAYRLSIDSGDTLFAGYAQVVHMALYFTSNKPLSETLNIVEEVDETLYRAQDVGFYRFGIFFKALILYWQGESNLTIKKIGQMIEAPFESEARTITLGCYELYAHLLFVFGHYETALENSVAAYSLRNYFLGVVWNQDLYAIYALSIAQCYKDASSAKKKAFRKTYKQLLKKVREWFLVQPGNIEHKYLLMLAEWARLEGNATEAEQMYDKAIESAQEGGFIYFAAIANELAAKYYLSGNKTKFAKLYLQEAHYNYLRWGALAKTASLEKEYPNWLFTQKTSPELGVDSVSLRDSISSSTMNPYILDYISVLKATQAISSEIILDNLLREMIHIILENAGAERGVILLENAGNLFVAAEGYANREEIILQQGVAITDRDDLPIKLITYVKNSQEEVILSKSAQDSGRFMNDPYILTKKPKSLLCMPIKKQQTLIGILYLENDLIQDAFRKDLLQVLTLLSTQAAISLDNARLYAASEHFVPHAFLDQLNKKSLVSVKIGDSISCERTIMFCDIRGFTNISERIKPSEVFKFVNNFFGEMEPIISQYRGFIDKYIGDAIMALFGNPDSAVQAAIAMKHQLSVFNKEQQSQGGFSIDIGIGINTGELILGIIGNETRMEGTVIGHAVNTASRIEGLTKEYKIPLIITDNTVKKLMYPQHYALRQIDDVIIRGQTIPIGIYEVCAIDQTVVRNHKLKYQEVFNEARKLYQQNQFQKAEELFKSCLNPNIPDPVVNVYIERCLKGLENSNTIKTIN